MLQEITPTPNPQTQPPSTPLQRPRFETPAESLLVEGLKARNQRCYELMVRTYGGRMLAVARRLLRNEEEARDAVQEAFLAAFLGMPTFRQGCQLNTWLHRITVNASLMRLRRQACRPEVDLGETEDLLPTFDSLGRHSSAVPAVTPTPSPDPERELLREERRSRVRQAIDQLPERYRTVLILREIEELSTREVAEQLSITSNAVKIRLHRARLALTRVLSKNSFVTSCHLRIS